MDMFNYLPIIIVAMQTILRRMVRINWQIVEIMYGIWHVMAISMWQLGKRPMI